MGRITLSLAIDEYEHTREIVSGAIPVEGVDIVPVRLPIEEIFFRMSKFHEFDIAELSSGKYISLRSQGDNTFTALPIFVSRAFRHSSFYVRADGAIRHPEQLAGKRVGIPEWAQTASVYSRGLIVHEYGVPLASIEWVQAGVNEPGRVEKVDRKLPEGVRYRQEPTKCLNDMLLAGELDCVLTARPPKALGNGIVRLFPEYQPIEEAYYKKTGIYPIMHTVVVKTSVLEQHPWVAMNLFKAFDLARRRSMARMDDITASHAPLAWLKAYSERNKSIFGEDFFPYGLEPNRKTLEAFLRYGFEQGVCFRKLTPEELYPAGVLASFKV